MVTRNSRSPRNKRIGTFQLLQLVRAAGKEEEPRGSLRDYGTFLTKSGSQLWKSSACASLPDETEQQCLIGPSEHGNQLTHPPAD